MNLQSLMKQAQSMQKNIMNSKKEIESMTFIGKSELVEITMNGKKQVLSVKIKQTDLDSEDIEILEDMIMIATNDAIKKVNEETEKKLGAQAGEFGDLF